MFKFLYVKLDGLGMYMGVTWESLFMSLHGMYLDVYVCVYFCINL